MARPSRVGDGPITPKSPNRVEMEADGEALSVTEAAAILRISPSTLYRQYHLRRSHLPATRVDGRLRPFRTDVEAWKAAQDRWISVPKRLSCLDA